MDRADVPSVKAALKAGWKNLLIPIIILLPFLLDYFLKPTLYAKRLGAGAGNMSSSILVFTPGIAAGYALLVNRKNVPLGGLVRHIVFFLRMVRAPDHISYINCLSFFNLVYLARDVRYPHFVI